MSAISLSKLDKDLAEHRISRDEYIDRCKYFFDLKRKKYRDTYHKRKQKDMDEENRGERELSHLKSLRNHLHSERYELNVEIEEYKRVLANELNTFRMQFSTHKA